jgi:hypothetical protein
MKFFFILFSAVLVSAVRISICVDAVSIAEIIETLVMFYWHELMLTGGTVSINIPDH